ncbi:MAG: hypothetical protein XD78_1798, partial [Desulfotomaculum sp. 46_296]
MKLFDRTVSNKLEELINEVTALEPDKLIKWELIDELPEPCITNYEGNEFIPKIIISKSLIDENSDYLTPEAEIMLAHELLHIFLGRKKYPRVFSIKAINNPINHIMADLICDLAENNLVFKELENRNFNLDLYKEGFNKYFYNWELEDPADARLHIIKAFRAAIFYLYLKDEETFIYLENNFPNTVQTALKLADIMQLSNPQSPDNCRRCMIKIIRLVDDLTTAIPAFAIRLGIDLVLSERQLASYASQYIRCQRTPAGMIGNAV